MSGVLRSLPVLAPTEVSRITGLPCRSLPCSPFVASISSACFRDQSDGLGSYSPVRGMLPSCHAAEDPTSVRQNIVAIPSSGLAKWLLWLGSCHRPLFSLRADTDLPPGVSG